MKYYVDIRVHEIVPETKLNLVFMAPELYYEYCDSGVENQIKEVWKCRSGKEVEYVLPVENYGTDKEMNLRMAYFNAIGEVPVYLQKFEVPHSWYVEKMKEIGE